MPSPTWSTSMRKASWPCGESISVYRARPPAAVTSSSTARLHAYRIASGALLHQGTEVRCEGGLRPYALRASPPLFSEAPSRGIRFLLQLVETVPNGFRIACQEPRHVLDPAMPQLGGLDGGISPSSLLRQPPQKALHHPFESG